VAIIIFCFVYIVRTILRQKEFAGRLSDFINNMTHEFKTPISTISLASEAIARPENSRSQPKVKRYNGMIADENNRMKKQVEKILQMSALEEGDYELNLVPVDVHKVITKAVESISLQMTARKGSITTTLGASRSTIHADAVHLENIIHNVLDNAVKYTRDTPKIVVSTASGTDRLIIRVQDNGIGIADEHLEKVFEKYYRVPTGNLHDVKGFGLGLSYVKLVTEAHHGTITIQSLPGAGTTVELRFPLS
ncbi:MAG TPA: HAMP domain-containing sensor histidine kinase, partial [Bacteroidota bacterium]